MDAAYLAYRAAPGLITAAYFAQATREAGVSTIVKLSQRSASHRSNSDTSGMACAAR
jgi:hypothetical protein